MSASISKAANAEVWVYAAAGLAALSGLLFTAAPAQFGGVVAICQQAASRLMTLPDDFVQQAVVGMLFFGATVWQWMMAALLVANRSRPQPALLWTALGWTLAVLGLWVVVRLAGVLWPGFSAVPVSLIEFLARAVEVALAACLAVLLQEARRPVALAPV
jgi:hypothetical protein